MGSEIEALGYLGLNRRPAAADHLAAVLTLQADHQGALLQRRWLSTASALAHNREAHV